MSIFKEAGTGLFSLFDKVDSLDVNQKNSVFRAQIVTAPTPYKGPVHEFKTANDQVNEGKSYPGRTGWKCKVRILNPNMPHEKLLGTWGDDSTAAAADLPKNALLESFLTTMIIPSNTTMANCEGLQKKDIVFIRMRPGDNNMTYSMQYCDFKSIDIRWPREPNCNTECHLSLEQLHWLAPEDVIYAPTPEIGGWALCPWWDHKQQITTTWDSTEYSEWNETVLKNGDLADTGMLTTDSATGAELVPPAMEDFKKLAAAYKTKFNKTLKCSGYRDYAGQEEQRMLRDADPCGAGKYNAAGEKKGRAATPGTSNHGWGAAVDLRGWLFHGGAPESAEFKWVNKFSKDYNFVFGVGGEHWHLDWMPFSEQVAGGVTRTAQSSWVPPAGPEYDIITLSGPDLEPVTTVAAL